MNLRRTFGTFLATGGVMLLMAGVGTLPVHGAERFAPPQPSPRPTINPVKHSNGEAVQMGHITGTVIDQRTGAPAAGISVNVGGEMVVTDANGNYDHWVPVGSYPVSLSLAAEQGTPTQGRVTVDVQPDTATVQHLSFTSSEVAAPAATATPVITAVPQPTALPSAHPAAAPKAAAAKGTMPTRLPRTADGAGSPWMWLLWGMLLLLAGGFVGFAPVLNGRSAAALLRVQAANSALLQTLLAQPPVDELLAALFADYDRTRK
ncbi:MAG: hypothetical protein JST60_07085 [Chloroflexi bacterium SZAS-1]|nr:hypothetical protein [Chloroflexi bacterium SZAS-1]